jgi:nucleoside-diphosphate-sugar epimerase
MSEFVVVGAGSTGTGVARRLSADGHEVRIVSRRGRGPEDPRIERVALDATNGAALASVASGARAIFNCANPPYHRWASDWPPIASSLLSAAESSGATLVTLSNLYVYGEPSGPMRASDPMSATYEKAQVRATMWREALERHRAGAITAVEVRASDFVGPGAEGVLGQKAVDRILAGKSVMAIGDLDAAHSWTYVGDVSATLVAVATNEQSWGRPWHVPTNAPRSIREVVADLATAGGVAPVRARGASRSLLRVAGLFSPMMRELPTTLYQFERPFVIDDADTREELGLQPTPWAEVMAACVGQSAQHTRAG